MTLAIDGLHVDATGHPAAYMVLTVWFEDLRENRPTFRILRTTDPAREEQQISYAKSVSKTCEIVRSWLKSVVPIERIDDDPANR